VPVAQHETEPPEEWEVRGAAAAAALAETWGSLSEVCRGLAPEEWEAPTGCPGWSVRDQLSHLIGIERTLEGQAAPEWDGPLGDHVKNDFAAMNERWVAPRRARSGVEVLAEFDEVTRLRLASLAALTPAEWAHVGFSPVGEVPYAEFMEVRVFDSWVHEQDVRSALDRPDGSGGAASRLSLDRMQAAMGFVVGKKSAAPDGSVVRFSVRGPGSDERRFAIGVEGGRARPVDDDVAPTVSLSMSSLDFTRLACGRATAEETQAAGGIGLEGDVALGQTVLGTMNFMF
jgi:uncharacterized protein (TIGR03083 family)